MLIAVIRRTTVHALVVCALLFSVNKAYAVAEPSKIYTVTVWKVHPGKHQAFIEYMTAWEQVFSEVKAPPMKWYRKISGDSYDFISISPPFNSSAEHAMEAAGKKRGLPIGYNYVIKLNELADSYVSTLVEGPQSMADLLVQTQK